MYRSGGGIILLIASLVYAFWGSWRLIVQKRWLALLGFIVFLYLYYFAGITVFEIKDQHIRIWCAIPLALILPYLWGIGFFINYSAEKEDREKFEVHVKRGIKQRLIGGTLFIIGVLAWYYGLVHPELTRGIQVLLLAIFGYGCLIGVNWLVTNKSVK